MSQDSSSNERVGLQRAIEMARQSGVINLDATVSELLDQASSLELESNQRVIKSGGGDPAELKAWGVLLNKCYLLVNECD